MGFSTTSEVAAMYAPEALSFVNDVHSGLNVTCMNSIVTPRNVDELRAAIAAAAQDGLAVSICGARHAMGGQQFAAGAVLLDMRLMDRVLAFDQHAGLIEAEAGIMWPALIDFMETAGDPDGPRWSIRQKQTGADRLTLGGCLAANVHGRGLAMGPFINDVEAFTLLDANGNLLHCSRSENARLFALAIGGYGLFGVIVSVTLRLMPRQKMRRDVVLLDIDALMPAFASRKLDGYLYGDFQFAIDPDSTQFMRRGVFSCYCPVDPATPMGTADKALSDADWRELLTLAHTDKGRAFDCYASHYLATHGQVAWSDRLQQSTYLDGYHGEIDSVLGHVGSEVIGELYVPRASLPGFMRAAAADLRAHRVNLIYGTIRLIEADHDSFMPWARQDCACVIFNLHTAHTPEGVAATDAAFQRLISLAIARGGSFYLTYSRAATAVQVQACYPQFTHMLAWKRHFDPQERFQSDWYRHYRDLFAQVRLEHAA